MSSVKPYEGDKPYIFISYAHANTPAVMQVVEELSERGFRIWYDEGIEVGTEWPEYIARHLAGAAVMLAFLSNAYMRSDNCRKEMHFAQTKRIQTLNIFLEQTQMTPGMEMQVGSLFALMKYTMSDEVFYDKLFAAPQLDPGRLTDTGHAPKKHREKQTRKVPVDLTVEAKKQKRKKTRHIVGISLAALLLIACVVLGIIGYSTGFLQRVRIGRQQTEIAVLSGDTAVQMQNTALEQAVRSYRTIPEGPLSVSDLVGITEMRVSETGVSFNGEPELSAEWTAEDWQELSDLRYFTGLIRLSFANLRLTSLETMPACGIEYLTINACPLNSLDGIGNLTALREIETTDTPIRKLGDLGQCLQLRRMSLLGANPAELSAVKPLIRLTEVGLSHCGINDLRPLLGLSSLTDVTLCDSDLRGSFFKAFDRERAIVNLTLTDCKLNSTVNLGDFTGLTTLSLVRTGETLDWSALARLPALKTVYVDETMEHTIRTALSGSDISLVLIEDQTA